MTQQYRSIQDHCPAGYRFKYQAVGTKSCLEAVQETARIFRVPQRKLIAKRGVYMLGDKQNWTHRVYCPDKGYMVFILLDKPGVDAVDGMG